MAKARLNLPEGWTVEEGVLAKSLAQDAKVLFIYATNYETIKKLAENFNITATIFNDDFEELEKARKFGFEVASGNINAGGLDDFKEKEFDYVVCEDGLNSARYPGDFLKSAVRIGKNFVLCQENKGRFMNRLKFLVRGSLYTSSQYDVIPDDEVAWFNKDPWFLTHKDVVNLCACFGLAIKKGTIIYKNGDIDNMYDIRSYPNFSAMKVYYIISDDSTLQPTYKMGGATI